MIHVYTINRNVIIKWFDFNEKLQSVVNNVLYCSKIVNIRIRRIIGPQNAFAIFSLNNWSTLNLDSDTKIFYHISSKPLLFGVIQRKKVQRAHDESYICVSMHLIDIVDFFHVTE